MKTGTVEVEVKMVMYGDGKIRTVEIPVEEFNHAMKADDPIDAILALTFYFGQNDFQPKPFPSVSVGDVILLLGDAYRVAGMGFEKLPVSA